MKFLKNKFLNNNSNTLVLFVDLFLFGLVFAFFFYDILILIISFYAKFNIIYTDNYTTTDILFKMVSISNTTNQSTDTTTVIHNDSGWANSIGQIFIYGSGALRFHFMRGFGTPAIKQRGFVITSTLAADAFSKFVANSLNDPEYVEKQINSWKRIVSSNKSTVEIHIDKDADTIEKLNAVTKKFSSNDLDNWSENILNAVIDLLKPILQPVTVDYSNEILSTQIYGISIMLFILSVLIIVLLIAFMINILILVYSDKLMNFFTNKYIRWYILYNKKLVAIEIFFLGSSILYFMYVLSYGLHFIATHPIPVN